VGEGHCLLGLRSSPTNIKEGTPWNIVNIQKKKILVSRGLGSYDGYLLIMPLIEKDLLLNVLVEELCGVMHLKKLEGFMMVILAGYVNEEAF